MTLKHNLSTIATDIDDITVSMSERLAKATNDISALIEELEQLDFYEWLKTYFKGYNLDNLYDFSKMLKKFVEHEVLG